MTPSNRKRKRLNEVQDLIEILHIQTTCSTIDFVQFYDSYLVYLNTRNIIKKIGLRSEKTYEVSFRFSLFNMCAFPCYYIQKIYGPRS